MSRSRKKAILKDKADKRQYWRTVRSATNNAIRSCKNWEDLEIPDPRTIYNDYDYCDWVFKTEYDPWINIWYTHEDLIRDRKLYRRK